MMKISVVIPLYNKVSHIERALQSVLAQTEQDFEVIVVDDGSTDGGEGVVRAIKDDRIRLFSQENRGVSAARNKGIELAQTDLTAFLDADDAYKPNFLETILRLRDKYPEAGAYSTAYEIVKRGGKIRIPRYKAIPPAPWEGLIPNYFESALGIPPVCTSATAVPKNVFDKVGYFPLGEKKGEDLDMWLRIALEYPIAFSNYMGATYFLDADNRSGNLKSPIRERLLILPKKEHLYQSKLDASCSFCLAEYMNKQRLCVASQLIRLDDIQGALEFIQMCTTRRYVSKKMFFFLLCLLPGSIRKAILKIRYR
jgi:glycosyltransferase involved in cell wall biosynthesis